MTTLEQGLAYALRQYATPRPKQHTSKAPGLKGTLSVRHPSGGRPFQFEYQANTISRLGATLRAEAAARSEGLTPWALLEIAQD